MLFSQKPTKARLRQYKHINACGMRFVIQKINPLADFPVDKIPQIFTSFVTKRKAESEVVLNEATIRRGFEDMKNIINAGLIKPELGKDIFIDDIMSDSVLAMKLYVEIVAHSLTTFRGMKGLFFSARIRRLLFMELQKNLEKPPPR